MAAPVDKDSKRRVFMDTKGFLYRMVLGFMGDDKHYVVAKGMSVDSLARYKN